MSFIMTKNAIFSSILFKKMAIMFSNYRLRVNEDIRRCMFYAHCASTSS